MELVGNVKLENMVETDTKIETDNIEVVDTNDESDDKVLDDKSVDGVVKEVIDKVGGKIKKYLPKKDYVSKYRKEQEKKEKEAIEAEKLDDSPRYKCDMPTMSVNGYVDILKNNKYKKGIKKWNIWFPEGYNNIDDKLKKIKLSNDEQIIFTIPECDSIVSKYNVWKSLNDFYGRERASTIIPESFLLDKKDDIKLIDEQPSGTDYILKKKKQRKEGLKITSDVEEVKKGHKEDYLIAQRLIKPFLVNKRKINLRVYLMLTLYKGKLVAYVSKFGSCIYTKDEYDDNSHSFETNVTSYKMDMDIYNDNPLSFEQFKTYLKDNNYNHVEIFDKMKGILHDFLIAMKEQLGSKKFHNNLCSQVFGVDFIIDEELNPLLLECNKGPEMKPKVTTINEPEEVTDIMLEDIENLREILSNGSSGLDKIKNIKKSFQKIYKDYPKSLSNETILERIEKFYKDEEEQNAYPTGYRTGNGLKVQKDTLDILGMIKGNENNGYEKILEI